MSGIAAERAIAVPRTEARRGLQRGRTWILAGGDAAALVGAYALAYVVAEQIGPLPAVSAPGILLALLALTALPVWLAIFTGYKLYDNDAVRISVSSVDEVREVFHAMLVGSLAYLILSQGLHFLFGWWIYTPVEAALFGAGALVFVPATRYAIRGGLFRKVMRRRRTLIVGTGPEAQLVHAKLVSHPEYGLDVVGFVAAEDGAPAAGPVVGGRDDLAELVDELEIDRVLLASPVAPHEEMLDMIRSVRRPDVHVSIVPRYFEIFTSHARLDDVEGMPVVSLPQMRLGKSARLLKRSFDVALSGLALLVLSPLLAATALAVRLDSRGPAIFRQPRRGRDGEIFRIAKFRTMVDGAEAQRDDLVHLNQVDGPLFKVKAGDPRVTRLGAFLRRTSIDELPQLWNVLRGEMSLVGPRPFVVHEADQIDGWASKRLAMTPGITGVWQVLGRNDIPFAEMVKLDYLYVTNWSLWWDLKLLCQTIPVVLARKGAY